MAKIIAKKTGASTSDAYYAKLILKGGFYWFLVLCVVALMFFTKGLSGLLLLPFPMLFRRLHGQKSKIMAGEVGEVKTTQALQKLPSYFTVIEDVVIPRKSGSKSQIDHLLIGKYGVFVIETKFHTGTISGNDGDVKILQKKRLKNGGKYETRFLNPVLQVETQARAVREWLEGTDYHDVAVTPVVYFANKNAKLRLKSDRVYIAGKSKFFGDFRLRRYVKKKHGDGVFLRSDRKALVQYFTEFL